MRQSDRRRHRVLLDMHGALRHDHQLRLDAALIMRRWRLLSLLFLFCVGPAQAAIVVVPPNAKIYLPLLQQQIDTLWPTLKEPAVLAGQIEQETCISLTWPSCWNPHTELKTSREYGFGFGQITVTSSMNIFTSLPKLDPAFKTWQWTDRYNPTMQMRAVVDMDRQDFNYFKATASETDQLAFMLSSYNGGPGSVMNDIRYCLALADCDHTKWFGNVETHSTKAKTSLGAAYGTGSAFSINRSYVSQILHTRMLKYESYFTRAKP